MNIKYNFVYDEKNNQAVLLQSLGKRNNVVVTDNMDEIMKIIHYIAPSSFVIFSENHNYVKLTSEKEEVNIVIRGADSVLGNPLFVDLNNEVVKSCKKNGYVYIDNKRNINEPSRLSKYVDSVIKKMVIVGAYAAIITAVAVNTSGKGETEPIVSTGVEQTAAMDEGEPIKDETTVYASVEAPIVVETSTSFDSVSDKAMDGIYLEFEDLSDTPKARNTKNTYYGTIEKYSHLMGLDPNLILSIATQERGVHDTKIDAGGAIGLMQIQYSVWDGKSIPYYELNEETGKYEQKVIENINMEKIQDLDTNIKIACAILQNCLLALNYNIPASIQAYTMGEYDVFQCLVSYASECGVGIGDVLNNPDDIGWIKYRGEHIGDAEYLEHVNQWASNNEFSFIDVRDGSTVSVRFTNNNENVRKKFS